MEVDLMRSRHWSPSGAPGSRIMLITVPLVITMAVGLVLGLHFVSRGNANLKLSAQGAGAAPATPSAIATARATASPAATASAAPTATATAARAAAAANVSCVLIVPANPLTARAWPRRTSSLDRTGCPRRRLAAPWPTSTTWGRSPRPRSWIRPPARSAPTSRWSSPRAPSPRRRRWSPRLPAGAVVTIDFGFNGTNLTLRAPRAPRWARRGASTASAGSHLRPGVLCNGVAFFAAANEGHRERH